ncbi:MAG: hypothetical protein ACRDE6_03080 [Candidatus Limnocylindria bacterium]
MRRLVRLLIASQLVLAGLLVGTSVSAAADAYTIVDLGTLGGVGSGAAGVNEAGDVVGTSNTSWGEPHAFRWRAGTMTGIHAMGGSAWGSDGTDISDDGWVVGSAGNNNGYAEAMYWFGADPHPAGTLGDFWSQAFAINNEHQIVGRSPNSEGLIEAFSWSEGVITGLGGLVEGDYSEAWDINDAGMIVGEAGAAGGFVHAFRHADGVMTDLGTPSPTFETSWARGINEAGTIVGGSQVADGGLLHPFVLAHGSWDVITDVHGYADAVNGPGQVVGTLFTPAGESAFIYEDGVVTDLNQLLPAGSGWQLAAAIDINDAGQIVGQGMHDGEGRGFLLTPTTPSADLALSVSASPQPLLAGTDATFVASVENLGPDMATNVQLSVQLPVNQASASCVAAGGTCAGSGSSWTVTFASVTAGEQASATFTVGSPVAVADGVAYGASASVQADQADPDASNDQASASVTISNRADLAVSGVADRRAAKVGQLVTYTFGVLNSGPGAAGAVVLTDQLPAGLSLISSSTNQGSCSGTGVVNCSLGTMASGASTTVTIHAQVIAGGGTRIVNSAAASSPNHDPVPGNDTASVTVDVKGRPSR